MAEHIWSVACRRAIIDSETNTTTLVDCVEKLSAKLFLEEGSDVPDELPIEIVLVSLWSRSELSKPETTRARLQLHLPKESVLKNPKKLTLEMHEFDIHLEQHERCRTFANIRALPVCGPGIVKIYVQQLVESSTGATRWRTESKIPIEIDISIE